MLTETSSEIMLETCWKWTGKWKWTISCCNVVCCKLDISIELTAIQRTTNSSVYKMLHILKLHFVAYWVWHLKGCFGDVCERESCQKCLLVDCLPRSLVFPCYNAIFYNTMIARVCYHALNEIRLVEARVFSARLKSKYKTQYHYNGVTEIKL